MSKLAHSSDKHMAELERKHALEDGITLWDCTICGAGSIGDPPDCPLDAAHCNFVKVENSMSDPSNSPEHQIGMLVHSIERDVDELKEIYLSLDGPDLLRTEIDRLRSAAKKLNRVLELVPRIQEIA